MKLARPLGKMIPTFLKHNCFGKISLIESLENLCRLKFPGTLWGWVGGPISNDAQGLHLGVVSQKTPFISEIIFF